MLTPWFESEDWRTLRLGVFMAPGIASLIPIVHMHMLYPSDDIAARTSTHYWLLEGLFLILGSLIYGMRIPEVWRPGQYDLFGSSHQIFHVCVVVATAIHVMGLQAAFEYNYRRGGCAS